MSESQVYKFYKLSSPGTSFCIDDFIPPGEFRFCFRGDHLWTPNHNMLKSINGLCWLCDPAVSQEDKAKAVEEENRIRNKRHAAAADRYRACYPPLYWMKQI